MSLFKVLYDCHPGAIVMRKADGAVFCVRGNRGVWDMTAILDPFHPDSPDCYFDESPDVVCVNSVEFKEQFLVLEEGIDLFAIALRKITTPFRQ